MPAATGPATGGTWRFSRHSIVAHGLEEGSEREEERKDGKENPPDEGQRGVVVERMKPGKRPWSPRHSPPNFAPDGVVDGQSTLPTISWISRPSAPFFDASAMICLGVAIDPPDAGDLQGSVDGQLVHLHPAAGAAYRHARRQAWHAPPRRPSTSPRSTLNAIRVPGFHSPAVAVSAWQGWNGQHQPPTIVSMSDPSRTAAAKSSPPPAPPLPRPGVLQRLVAPLGFGSTSRPPSRAQARGPSYTGPSRHLEHVHGYAPLPSQTTAHKTRIPIAALDINSDRTHAILAGKEILKTVRIEDGKIIEELNLKSKILQYASTHTTSDEISNKRRDYLPATDVKWSHGNFENVIATAASNGRIALYDISRAELERAWLHDHTGSVHRLAFDPHIGALLLSGSHDGTVRMWDLRTLPRASSSMKSVKRFQCRVAGVRDVKWCPTSPTDAVEFVLSTDTGVVQKWDIRNPNAPILSINGHGGKPCLSVDWHPDGKHVVSGGLDKYIRVWDFQSDNRKQKPKFEMKAPQALRNVRWRPACWSSELTGTGQWQCTQLAASYHQDDPRVHIWDLRRPLLPFRELERYRNPARDLLWATKDLIWTVGDEGMFTQTDVSFAPLVHASLSSVTMDWMPTGEYAVFAEDTGLRRGSGMEDPAVGFLSVSQEKLSGGEEAAISTSLSDEEEGVEGLLPNAFKRRQSRATSSRSAKSTQNTPPAIDGFPSVVSLEKAVFERYDLFNNKQIGMVGKVEGLAADPEVVSFLADTYAPPNPEAQRKADPGLILARLENAFNSNADACDMVSMHRTAQSWRILGAVIVPELRDWAERNRAERLGRIQQIKEARLASKEKENETTPLEAAVTSNTLQKTAAESRKAERPRSNLLKGLIGSEKFHALHDMDSTSNVTTPMARPLPDSPMSEISSPGRYQNLDEALEKLPQLPPSVLASHTTAAAASRVLRDSSPFALSKQLSPSTSAQGEDSGRKHRRTGTSESMHSTDSLLRPPRQPPFPNEPQPSDYVAPKAKLPRPQRQEDRRAALKDYRAQSRPLLTFDEPPSSPTPAGIPAHAFTTRHDSTDSFPMFSASTDSSHRDRSLGGSFESPERRPRTSNATDGWSDPRDSVDLRPSSPPSNESSEQTLARRFASQRRHQDVYNVTQGFGMDGAGDFIFGLDGSGESKEAPPPPDSDNLKPWQEWDDVDSPKTDDKAHPSFSSSPEEPFHFEPLREIPETRIHNVNPILHRQNSIRAVNTEQATEAAIADDGENVESSDLIYSDFRPIDLTTYEPRLPFAWSAVPLITQAIAFDLTAGPACAQFSVHLLMHVHPYFFHHSFRDTVPKPNPLPSSMAERLMEPALHARLIEGIFASHDTYLQKTGLFVPMAEMRKMSAEFDYPRVYQQSAAVRESGLVGDKPHTLSVTCGQCNAPMPDGMNVCARCGQVRSVCPICLSLVYSAGPVDEPTPPSPAPPSGRDQGLWSFCHGCGHSAHLGCMEGWLAHPYSDGECPSHGCGHDCGPGMTRRGRMARQAQQADEAKQGKPAAAVLKKDAWKASPSAAVERTRKNLRGLGNDYERGTQSGDERTFSSFASRSGRSGRGSFSGGGGGGGGSGVGPGSQRKSVRVVTPKEEELTGR